MKKQSKRKFTYQGQAYDLPDYFDCCLEIYAIESDPEIFPCYSKPTIRNSLNIQERWCRTSKAEVLGPIHWDLVTDHADAIKIIAENTRMGKYLSNVGMYEANQSIFAAKCPVRFKAGTAIFKLFFNEISGVPSYLRKEGLFLSSFRNVDCATLYKCFLYQSGDEVNFDSDIFLSPSLEHVREDYLELRYFYNESWTAKTIIGCMLHASTSLKEFFNSAEILKTLDLSPHHIPDIPLIDKLLDSGLIERPDNVLGKNSFEIFTDVPPAIDCDLGTVNYLSLWYQVKKQLFDIIND